MQDDKLSYPPAAYEKCEFFVPGATSVQESEEAWKAFSEEAVVPTTSRKVQRLVYRHNGDAHVSEVGYLEHDGTREWLVPAIHSCWSLEYLHHPFLQMER